MEPTPVPRTPVSQRIGAAAPAESKEGEAAAAAGGAIVLAQQDCVGATTIVGDGEAGATELAGAGPGQRVQLLLSALRERCGLAGGGRRKKNTRSVGRFFGALR